MAGRPRDPDLEKRLLAAAWSLLTSRGYDALTFAQVATEAQAHRTDVYRRWSSKAALVTDALAEHLPPISEVDTGSLYADLRAIVDDFAASWSAPWMDGVVGLLADLQRDSEAFAAFRRMGAGRAQPVVIAVDQAARRGEIDETPDLSVVLDLLEGPLMHSRLFTGRPPEPEDLDIIALAAHRLLTGRLESR